MLQNYFASFGELKDVFLPQGQPADSTLENPKGFGYVTFIEPTAAYRCLGVPAHNIAGFAIDVQEARAKGARGQPPVKKEARVFVGRIPPTLSEEAVRAHFSQFGEVREFHQPQSQGSRDGMGIAFITYNSIQEVATCLANGAEQTLLDGTVLTVIRARPRGPKPTEASSGMPSALSGVSSQPNPLYQTHQGLYNNPYGSAGAYPAAAAVPGVTGGHAHALAAGQQQYAHQAQAGQFDLSSSSYYQQQQPVARQYGTQAQTAGMQASPFYGQQQYGTASTPQGYSAGYGATQTLRSGSQARYTPY